MSELILIEKQVDGHIVEYPLKSFRVVIRAQSNATYLVIDKSTWKMPEDMILRRKGDTLEVQIDEWLAAHIDDFYAEGMLSTFSLGETSSPTEVMIIHGGTAAGVADGAVVWQAAAAEEGDGVPAVPDGTADQQTGTPHAADVAAGAPGGTAVWQAAASEEGGISNWVWGGLAVAGGIGLAAAASGGGDDGGGGGTPPVSSYSMTVLPAAGPFTSDALVEVYDQNGNLLTSGNIDTGTGDVTLTISNGYSGPLLVKVIDNNGAAGDYTDETTGALTDLAGPLRALVMAGGSGDINLTVSPLTELAVRNAGIDESNLALTADDVAANNGIGRLFGVDDITGAVTTVLDTDYDTGEGLDPAEHYGNVLAMLSGANATTGSMDATLDQLESAISTMGDGNLVLDQEGVQLLFNAVAAFESGVYGDEADLGDALLGLPLIAAAEDGLNAAEKTGGVDINLAGAAAGDQVTIYWGDLAYTYTVRPGDIDGDGLTTVTVPEGVVDAAGDGIIEVGTRINDGEKSPVVVISVDISAPVFTSGATADAIDENSGAGQTVYTAIATDNAAVIYSLKAVDDGELFSIDSISGDVALTGNPDYEIKASFSFTVMATDELGNTSEQAVALNVNNLDEFGPTITSGATADAIDENSGAEQVVYTVTSSDAGDVSGGVTYSLSPVNDDDLFSIDSISGDVMLTDNPDYETKAGYSFTVAATDSAGNSSEQAVTLDINNLDEIAPTITSGATTTAINENSGAEQVVYTVTSDDSADISDGVTYSLKAGVDDAADFSIDAVSGAVTLNDNPDYETQSSYSFTVVATDSAGNSSEQAVALAINDIIDESAPVISSIAISDATGDQYNTLNAGDVVTVTVTMSEATTVTGSPQLALNIGGNPVQAGYSSGSGTTDLEFAYTIQPGENDTNGISIDADSLSLNSGSLTDGTGNPAILSHGSVSDDANYLVDTALPVFTSGATATAIDENSGGGQVIYTAAATDAGAVTYALKSGVGDEAVFSIDSGSGVVILSDNPDYEIRSSYNFTVVATDAAGNTSEQAVTLPINDMDEAPPAISSIAFTEATGDQYNTLNAGDVVTVTVTMSEATIVSGSPQLAVNIGGTPVQAGYNSGSGTTDLAFTYIIQPGENDTNGMSIDADSLSLNGGSLTDGDGNDATLTHSAVTDNADYRVDTTAPTLSTASPADEATDVAVDTDITLTFDEDIALGSSGTIIITDGSDSHSIDVGSHAGQLDVSGNTLTINPAADLANGSSTYHVEVSPGAVEDLAGNDYAGITDATTLNFTTETVVNTSIVVFDLVNGNVSDHSNRTFDSDETYTIYVIVDSDAFILDTDGAGWSRWTGGNSLGSDDTVMIVGDNGEIDVDPDIPLPAVTDGGVAAGLTGISLARSAAAFSYVSGEWLAVSDGGGVMRSGFNTFVFSPSRNVTHYTEGDLWLGAASDMQGPAGADHYLQNITALPAGVLTSQGLV